MLNQHLQFQIKTLEKELEKEKQKLQSILDQQQKSDRMKNTHDNLCKVYVEIGNIITSMSNRTEITIDDELREVKSDKLLNKVN